MSFPTRRTVMLGVTGALATPAIVTKAVAQTKPHGQAILQGLAYFQEQAALQQTLCADLTAAIASGDQDAAELAYEFSRAPYEQIEVHAGAFEDIDFAIDARPYAVEGGETNATFRGFHRIEALIYRDHDLAAALPYAQALERSIADLATALRQQDRFSAPQFMDGMLSLSEEVATKKISSEEETWSDLSLIIFRHNFIGIQSQFAGFAQALSDRSPHLVHEAELAFGQAQAVLEPFFAGPRVARYSDVRAHDRAAIARAAYGIRDAVRNGRDALDLV